MRPFGPKIRHPEKQNGVLHPVLRHRGAPRRAWRGRARCEGNCARCEGNGALSARTAPPGVLHLVPVEPPKDRKLLRLSQRFGLRNEYVKNMCWASTRSRRVPTTRVGRSWTTCDGSSTYGPHFTQRTHLHLGCGPRQLHSVPVWASPASPSKSEEKVWAGGPHSVIGCGPPAHHSEKVMKSVAR